MTMVEQAAQSEQAEGQAEVSKSEITANEFKQKGNQCFKGMLGPANGSAPTRSSQKSIMLSLSFLPRAPHAAPYCCSGVSVCDLLVILGLQLILWLSGTCSHFAIDHMQRKAIRTR